MSGIQDKAFNLNSKTAVDQIGQQWLQFDAWLHRPWGLRWCVGRRRQGGRSRAAHGHRAQRAPRSDCSCSDRPTASSNFEIGDDVVRWMYRQFIGKESFAIRRQLLIYMSVVNQVDSDLSWTGSYIFEIFIFLGIQHLLHYFVTAQCFSTHQE